MAGGMKKLLIATNCKSMVLGQMRRLGWNPDVAGVLWLENSPAVESFLAITPAPRRADVRFTTQFYRGEGLKGPDDKALTLLEKFEHTSMDEGMRWLMNHEKETT